MKLPRCQLPHVKGDFLSFGDGFSHDSRTCSHVFPMFFHVFPRGSPPFRFHQVDGPLFFTSANRLVKLLDSEKDPEEVELRFGEATLMDFTSVETLHKIALNYQNAGEKFGYPLVNIQKAMENGHKNSGCSH